MKKFILFSLFLFLSSQLFSVSHCNWSTDVNREIIAITAHNNYLYVKTIDSGVFVYTAPSNAEPALLATYSELSQGTLFFDNDRLYRSFMREIYCYDISDPEHITELGQIHVPESIVELGVGRIFIKDNLLSVSSWAYYDHPHSHYGESYTDLFEIVDYNTIQFLYSIYAGSDGEIEAKTFFLNSNDYLYVSPQDYELEVYDCSDLNNISLVTELAVGWTQFVSEEYIINYNSDIYHLESSTNPVLIADYNLGTTKAWQLGNQLVFNSNDNNTYFFDLETNELVGNYVAYDYKSTCMADFLFLAYDSTLLRIDISDHQNSDELYSLDILNRSFSLENDLIFYDNYSSVTYSDLTVQNNNEYTIEFSPGSYENGYLTEANNLLMYELTNENTRINLYNLEDPGNHYLELDFELSNIGYPFYISENMVYCANGYELNVIDLDDPQPENSITTITLENEYYYPKLVINDALIYMFRSNYCAVLNIEDIQNPFLATEQYFTYEGGTPEYVEMIGSNIYLLPHHSYEEIYTYDVSSPLEPELVDITNFGVHLDVMSKIDNKLLLTNNELNRIYTCDIVDNHPQMSNVYSWNNKTYDLELYDGNLLLATQDNGIIALSQNITPSPTVEVPVHNKVNLSNHPNPFNPNTVISFQTSDFSANSSAEIEIFNIKGQRIRELNIKNLNLKNNAVTWNGTDLHNNPVTSGIYLYQLKVDGETKATRKCLLLK